MEVQSGFSPVLFVGIMFIWYRDVYSSSLFVVLVSVVVILARTWVFQASLVWVVSSSRVVPAGIWASRFWHAWAVEMKETPTRDVTVVVLKMKLAPSRDVDVTLSPAGYLISMSLVLPVPRKVAYFSGAGSKAPQKNTVHSGARFQPWQWF